MLYNRLFIHTELNSLLYNRQTFVKCGGQIQAPKKFTCSGISLIHAEMCGNVFFSVFKITLHFTIFSPYRSIKILLKIKIIPLLNFVSFEFILVKKPFFFLKFFKSRHKTAASNKKRNQRNGNSLFFLTFPTLCDTTLLKICICTRMRTSKLWP